ncbi:MAG: hypothetical protein JNJ41_17230 [Bacteroidia bacterium]|nr:hypothetical protein [Bacteroidia bacterium]
MRTRNLFIAVAIISVFAFKPTKNWFSEKHTTYTFFYTSADQKNKKEYVGVLDNGVKFVKTFFDEPFKKEFTVYVHPDRRSLDTTWQRDFKMPEFRSECWMVASGMATKLDIISPVTWDKESCEHKYSEKIKTQELINHELFHVFHGQLNASPDFSDVDNIDWFVEGLAAYASGQCDSLRMAQVKKALDENKVPTTLDKFWTGKLKYGLSGSVVKYIDVTYGRKKLRSLLGFNKKQQILKELSCSEEELLMKWKEFMLK